MLAAEAIRAEVATSHITVLFWPSSICFWPNEDCIASCKVSDIPMGLHMPCLPMLACDCLIL